MSTRKSRIFRFFAFCHTTRGRFPLGGGNDNVRGHDKARGHDNAQKKEPSSVTSKAFGCNRLPIGELWIRNSS